jgi:hypothetical protein
MPDKITVFQPEPLTLLEIPAGSLFRIVDKRKDNDSVVTIYVKLQGGYETGNLPASAGEPKIGIAVVDTESEYFSCGQVACLSGDTLVREVVRVSRVYRDVYPVQVRD